MIQVLCLELAEWTCLSSLSSPQTPQIPGGSEMHTTLQAPRIVGELNKYCLTNMPAAIFHMHADVTVIKGK